MMVSEAESKSFLNYMKSSRDQYKNNRQSNHKTNIDFNFEDIEVDASTYGFITKENEIQPDDQLEEQSKSTSTEITTINLFEQNSTLANNTSNLLEHNKNSTGIIHLMQNTYSRILKIFKSLLGLKS